MKVSVYWTCPHCGVEQIAWVGIESQHMPTRKVVFCDSDKGGCDKAVALFVGVTAEVAVYKLVEVTS